MKEKPKIETRSVEEVKKDLLEMKAELSKTEELLFDIYNLIKEAQNIAKDKKTFLDKSKDAANRELAKQLVETAESGIAALEEFKDILLHKKAELEVYIAELGEINSKLDNILPNDNKNFN